jgi:hypothetical protein
MPPSAYQAVVNCAIVKADWADLQPTQGGPIAANNDIDLMIAKANQINAANPGLNFRLKLRVFAGLYSPEWAKHLDGAPVDLYDPDTSAFLGTVPKFWTANFKAAYDDLMAKLAAKYDQVPVITQVVISRCTTQFAEPMIRQARLAQNRENFLAAGYTVAQDKACQREQVDTHNRVWLRTASSYAYNPYQAFTASGVDSDPNFTVQMIDYCRQVLGSRCVAGNNSISSPLDDGNYTLMYDKLNAVGAPLYYQTATEVKIGDWRATLDWAADVGANMVELPKGYNTWPVNELAGYDARLESNPTG